MVKYSETVLPMHLESWSEELHALSIKSVRTELSAKEIELLINLNLMAMGEKLDFGDDEKKLYAALTIRFINMIRDVGGTAFVRLGSRSPKDSYWGYKNKFKCTTGEQVMNTLTSESERVYEDLETAKHLKIPAYIFIREFKRIPGHMEFRCFVQDNKLVGISQYFYKESFPAVQTCRRSIVDSIVEFYEKKFAPIWKNTDSVVFDVYLDDSMKVILIETNPWWEMTDPCLFKWTGEFAGDFDETFRYLNADIKMESQPL